MKLVPKRRFKGFSGEWEEKELGDLADIVGGGTPSTSNPSYWDGDIDWYSPTEIGDKVFVGSSVKAITQLGLEKSSANILPANRTVLFTSRAGIGDMAILCRPGATNQGFQSLVLKDGMDTYFVYSMGHSIKREAIKKASGSTFLEISGKELGKIKLPVPSEAEQQRIGSFFTLIDEMIDNERCNLEKLKIMKQAYLYEMFPTEGESVPKRRFAGFSGSWVEEQLGDITSINTGDSDVKDADVDGKYPFFVRSEIVQRSNKYTFDGEAILIPGEGRLGEIFHYIKGKFDYHQRVYKISDFDEIVDAKFIYYLMHISFKKHAMKYTVKSTVNSLRLPMLTEYTIRIPSLEEQTKIGFFFSQVDKKIAVQQAKVEKLKAMKQAYLNEMFV